LVAHTEGGMESEGVWEQGAEDNILAYEVKVTGDKEKKHSEELNVLYSLLNIVLVIKSRRMRWVGL
jgi:hypothetical protein